MFHLIIFANIRLFHILFFQYFLHVLTFFFKFWKSGDGGKGPERGKGPDRGKGPIPSITPTTQADEYFSDEEILESHNAMQTITLSLKKANKEFRDLVAAGLTTDEEFRRMDQLRIKIANYGVSHVI